MSKTAVRVPVQKTVEICRMLSGILICIRHPLRRNRHMKQYLCQHWIARMTLWTLIDDGLAFQSDLEGSRKPARRVRVHG